MTGTTALLISYSDIATDPRLLRQIGWLTSAGYTIDTLGLDRDAAPGVRDHFTLAPLSRARRSRPGSVFIYGLLPGRAQYDALIRSRIPERLRATVRRGGYDLIVFNEMQFVAWASDRRDFTPEALRAHVHLDMHEYRDPRLRNTSLWSRLTQRYYRWTRARLAGPFDTWSTVASAIGDLYVRDFGIAQPAIVRNAPDFVDQSPRPADPDRIRLLFHGMGSWQRGFPEIMAAIRALPERFSITFMLTPNRRVIDDLRALIAEDDAGGRIRLIPPVPMSELTRVINEYDFEVLFYRPKSFNLEFALPNKLFEAVQGRLGLVIGQSPMMRQVVEQYGNGIVVDGWEAEDLAAALRDLTAADVDRMKQGSDRAARDLNSEAEGRVFLRTVGAADQ